jgi:hypothetical protein
MANTVIAHHFSAPFGSKGTVLPEELLAQLADPRVRALKEYRRTCNWDLADRRQVRRTEVPPGVCEDCYRQRRSDTRPGDLYSMGYPLRLARLV